MIQRRILLPLALALFCSATAAARDYSLGCLEIGQPWARATTSSAPAGGGFLTITNKGTTRDRLIAVRTPVAEQAQVHEMKMDGNVMRMRALDGGLEILPGATVTLAPGGLHLMLMGLRKPLVRDTRVPLTLVFEKAGSVEIELSIEAMGAQARAHGS